MKRLAVLLIGLSMAICGIALFLDDRATCGGSEMRAGDTCVTYRQGRETTRTADEQRGADRFMAGLLGGVGVLLTLGTLATFVRRTPAPPPDRRALAASRDGWGYRETDERLRAGVQGLSPLIDGSVAPRDVLYGTLDGLRFEVFDFSFTSLTGDGRRDATAWVVHLPPTAPPGFRDWAAAQRPLYHSANSMVSTRDDVLCDVAVGGIRARRPDDLLRPVEGLVEIVRRYERDTAAG